VEKYLELDSSQIWHMCIACWIQAANANSEYVILIAFALQQWFHEHFSVLNYMHISCLVNLRFSVGFIESSS
jgi:hypothetical protein